MNTTVEKLLIDVGNTRIKWATAGKDALAKTGECLHRQQDPAAAMGFLAAIDAKPRAVYAANVAGDLIGAALEEAVRARWALPVRFASPQPRSGDLRNGYDDYRQMGVDRWLAMLAARRLFGGAACVVDAGTAVTIDQVDDAGRHLGGVIVPGLGLMRRALLSDTGDIGKFAIQGALRGAGAAEAPQRETRGKSTTAAIEGGIMAVICGLIEHCAAELGASCRDNVLVMTGGDAGSIAVRLRVAAEVRPALVLEGLMIYEFE